MATGSRPLGFHTGFALLVLLGSLGTASSCDIARCQSLLESADFTSPGDLAEQCPILKSAFDCLEECPLTATLRSDLDALKEILSPICPNIGTGTGTPTGGSTGPETVPESDCDVCEEDVQQFQSAVSESEKCIRGYNVLECIKLHEACHTSIGSAEVATMELEMDIFCGGVTSPPGGGVTSPPGSAVTSGPGGCDFIHCAEIAKGIGELGNVDEICRTGFRSLACFEDCVAVYPTAKEAVDNLRTTLTRTCGEPPERPGVSTEPPFWKTTPKREPPFWKTTPKREPPFWKTTPKRVIKLPEGNALEPFNPQSEENSGTTVTSGVWSLILCLVVTLVTILK